MSMPFSIRLSGSDFSNQWVKATLSPSLSEVPFFVFPFMWDDCLDSDAGVACFCLDRVTDPFAFESETEMKIIHVHSIKHCMLMWNNDNDYNSCFLLSCSLPLPPLLAHTHTHTHTCTHTHSDTQQTKNKTKSTLLLLLQGRGKWVISNYINFLILPQSPQNRSIYTNIWLGMLRIIRLQYYIKVKTDKLVMFKESRHTHNAPPPPWKNNWWGCSN